MLQTQVLFFNFNSERRTVINSLNRLWVGVMLLLLSMLDAGELKTIDF